MDDLVEYKKQNCEPGDRLSELPDSLIFYLFWLLPMRDAVRTTILSSRWKNLWTTALSLNFEEYKSEGNTFRVRSFINGAIKSWSGTRILNFKIDCGTRLKKTSHRNIDLLVDFATRNEVEDLAVDLEYADDIIGDGVNAVSGARNRLYWPPPCLYSCSSLRTLYLNGCNLYTPKDVGWNRLKILSIDGFYLHEDLVENVVSGSPNLEVFFLYLMENHEGLTIQSTSLKHLSILKYLYHDRDIPSTSTELRIWTPNLEKLEVGGVPYGNCLMNVPCLTRAHILFEGPRNHNLHLFSENYFVGETLRQILPCILHVEELELSHWCIKAIGAMRPILSPFPKVQRLKLNTCTEEHQQIAHLLENFPQLKTLVLQHQKVKKHFHCKESLEFKANLPDSFLQELRTVEISCAEVEDSIFPLIEILLKYARKLEKMVFRVKEIPPPSNSSLSKMMKMARSSPNAELLFCECKRSSSKILTEMQIC